MDGAVKELQFSGAAHPDLDGALRRALGGRYAGLSTYGADRPVSIWLIASADSADEAAALAIAARFRPGDPVYADVQIAPEPILRRKVRSLWK